MKYRLNAYFAVLVLAIIGSGASLIIIHVAYANTFAFTIVGGEANHAQFKELTR